MPAANDLNHSKYTVQNITNEWKKKKLNKNIKLRKVRNNEKKKANKHRLQLIHNSHIYISKKYM